MTDQTTRLNARGAGQGAPRADQTNLASCEVSNSVGASRDWNEAEAKLRHFERIVDYHERRRPVDRADLGRVETLVSIAADELEEAELRLAARRDLDAAIDNVVNARARLRDVREVIERAA